MSITHSWNGTVLTITSDAGTSSADLKGDTGCRGPQGPHGIVYDADGNIVMDGFATEKYVDDKFENINLEGYATEIFVDAAIDAAINDIEDSIKDIKPDMTGYATEEYVDQQITNVATGGSIDLSNYATKIYVASNALGGSKTADTLIDEENKTLKISSNSMILSLTGGFMKNGITKYLLVITYDDGVVDEIYFTTPVTSASSYFATVVNKDATYFTDAMELYIITETVLSIKNYEGYPIADRIPSNVKLSLAGGEYNTIEPGFIPIDNETIVIRNGKLVCVGGASYPSSEGVEY